MRDLLDRHEGFQEQNGFVLKKKEILGIQFGCLNLAQALDVLDYYISQRKTRQISFSNAYTVALCRQNPQFKNVLNNSSDIIFADGMSIVWGARWLGVRLPERVAGPDLTRALCARAEKMEYKFFLLGSTPENLALLEKKLLSSWPALQIAGSYSPPMCRQFTEEENRKIVDRVNDSGADILLVGLSCPKQEMWIAENKSRLNVPLCLGVGAAFDFLSGRVPRAPDKMTAMGLEWLYRLYREPRRLWRRYLLGNFMFIGLLFKECVRKKWNVFFNRKHDSIQN